MANLFETYTPSNIIQIAVRNMARRNWSMPLDEVNFALSLNDDKVELDFMILSPFKPFKTVAFVQNELTLEIYNLVIHTSPLKGSKYSVLHVKQVSYEEYEKARMKLNAPKTFEGGNPFIRTPDYLKRQQPDENKQSPNDN